MCLSSLKDQGRERTDTSGGREKVGESSAARRGQTEAGGERAADSGTTETRGGGESYGAAEEKKGERESSYKVINLLKLKCVVTDIIYSMKNIT